MHVEIPAEGGTSTKIAQADIENNVILVSGDNVMVPTFYDCSFAHAFSPLAPVPASDAEGECGNAPNEWMDCVLPKISATPPLYTHFPIEHSNSVHPFYVTCDCVFTIGRYTLLAVPRAPWSCCLDEHDLWLFCVRCFGVPSLKVPLYVSDLDQSSVNLYLLRAPQ
ncbi:hypothetical protein AHF37_05069 [Paragonimus kellicotti]|nr:hypothetical protein AHF37_05069 [Paragonimus kellicotti]